MQKEGGIEMKRRLLFISLALALVLVALAPAATLAKKEPKPNPTHFAAIMTPTAIDGTVEGTYYWPVRGTAETNVWPIYDEDVLIGWLIDGRSISGDVTDGFEGSFTFTYGGILDTVQSGSIQGMLAIEHSDEVGVLYMAASGTLEAEVIEIYEDYLPYIVPKTLSAELNGDVRIEAGTGAYSGIRGKGTFKTGKKEPLILHVHPDQHVYRIEGSIELNGEYDKKSLRDKGKWGGPGRARVEH